MSIMSIYENTKEQEQLEQLGENIHAVAIVLATCAAALIFFQALNGAHFKWFEWLWFTFLVLFGPWQFLSTRANY